MEGSFGPEDALAYIYAVFQWRYLQWTWNVAGKTRSVYLEPDQAALCQEWIHNNRRLNQLITRMRSLSMRAARLHKIAPK